MSTKMRLYVLIAFSVLIMTFAATATQSELIEIMQDLRDDSVEISDGLLSEDFDRVALAASGIANHAQIPPDQIQLVAAPSE